MSTIATASFIANAQASVIYGRELTAGELDQINAIRITLIEAGRQCSLAQTNTSGVTVSYWSNIDDANSYVAVVNAFSPAPTTLATASAV